MTICFRRAGLMILASFLLPISTNAQQVTLSFTLPARVQLRQIVTNPDGRLDTVLVCDQPGDSLHQIATARLYWQPVTGGGFRFHHAHSVTGREGQSDTFRVDPGPGANFYATVTNPIGESCPSNIAYVPGSQVTGVDDPAHADPLVSIRLWNVAGRPVDGPVASGIYFELRRYASGRTERLTVLYMRDGSVSGTRPGELRGWRRTPLKRP